jgi:hypothetical protein
MRHGDLLRGNQRMGMIYKNLDRMLPKNSRLCGSAASGCSTHWITAKRSENVAGVLPRCNLTVTPPGQWVTWLD